MCDNCRIDLSALRDLFKNSDRKNENLISILQKAQKIYGYLPMDVIYEIADYMSVSPASVLGVATFYTQFSLTKAGKNLILLCDGTACHVNGSERVRKAICKELGIDDGGTTEDGIFSLKTVACLGCCSLSPVMMVNDDVYGSLTPEKAVEILREIRRRDAK